MTENQKMSHYKTGWIGIRAERVGKSTPLLTRLGFWRENHASLNNRNGFDWVTPCRTLDKFHKMNWCDLAARGLVGVACWFSDAQWGRAAAVTDSQWQDRSIIEREFNAKYPSGSRAR